MRSMIYHDADSVMSHFQDAIHFMHADDLAFLLATGKSELEIRTQIALHLNREKDFNQSVAREWNRHDLALFHNGLPVVVVEGKSWLHADAVNEKKLMKGSKSIRHGIEEDLKKLEKSYNTFPELSTFITMLNFSIDVRRRDDSYKNAEIKYESTHLKGLKEFGSLEDLAGNGRSRISNLLSEYGTVKRIPIKVGSYLNMPMEADFYLLQPHF